MSDIVSASSNSDTGVFKIILKALKFTLVSYVISIVLLALLAVVVVYTDVSEDISAPSVKGITFFGAFLSGFLTSKTTGAKGWLAGILAGTLNVLILHLLGVAVWGAQLFALSDLVMLGAGALFGMLGGIFGVNFGNN